MDSQLKIKMKEWIFQLTSQDIHSITSQGVTIAYRDTVYRVFNESIKYSLKSKELPATLYELIHNDFFISQSMALRRILDAGYYKKKREVCSIFSIARDMIKHISLFNRQDYLQCLQEDELKQYANSESLGYRKQQLRDYREKNFKVISNGKEIASTELLHNIIDRLKRKKEKLDNYVNNYIAHSSILDNRVFFDESYKITIGYLQSIYKEIICANSIFGRFILGKPVLFEVPSINYNKFLGWDTSIVDSKYLRQLDAYWFYRVKLFHKWFYNYWNTNEYINSPYKKKK